jgi:hypothetical protein
LFDGCPLGPQLASEIKSNQKAIQNENKVDFSVKKIRGEYFFYSAKKLFLTGFDKHSTLLLFRIFLATDVFGHN